MHENRLPLEGKAEANAPEVQFLNFVGIRVRPDADSRFSARILTVLNKSYQRSKRTGTVNIWLATLMEAGIGGNGAPRCAIASAS